MFSYDAIEKLNIQAKNWKELITGEPFTRKDIIHIQVRPSLNPLFSNPKDPTDPNRGNVQMFYHIKEGITKLETEKKHKKEDIRDSVAFSSSSRVILAEIDAKRVVYSSLPLSSHVAGKREKRKAC